MYLVQPNEFPNKPFLFLNLTFDYPLLFHKFPISLQLWKYRFNWFHSSGNHQPTPFLIMTFNYEQRSPEDSEFWNKSLRKMCPQSVKLWQKSVKQPSYGMSGNRQWNTFPWYMWKCASSGKTRAAKHSKLTVRQEIISDLGKYQRKSLSWSCLSCKRKSPVPCLFKNRKCLFPKRKLQNKDSLILQGGKINILKLPFDNWLVYRGWSKTEECCSGWSRTEGLHIHSLLLEFEGGHLPAARAANAKWLPPTPAIPMLLWQPRLKLNSRGKTMEIKVILFLSSFLADA